jgi:hypothetical protein
MDTRIARWTLARDPAVLTAAITLALTFAFFRFPLALLFLVCLICVAAPDRRFVWVFLASACGLFTLLNASKQVAGDLVNYLALLEYIRYVPFRDLFDRETIVGITGSYRISEMGFYAPLWVLSKLFDNQRLVIAVGATLGIYAPTYLGLLRIARREHWSIELTLVIALFVFFAAINFVQTTHLLRQYIATSVIFLAFAYFLEGRRGRAALLALLGCTVHNAAAILVADAAALAVLFPYRRVARLGLGSLLLRLLAAAALLGASLAAVSLLEFQQFTLDESPISPWHYVVVGVFFAGFVVLHSGGAALRRYVHYTKLTFVIVYGLSLGFFIIGIRLFALRYLGYLEWLFGLMLGGILHAMPRERLGRYFFSRWAVIGAAALILLMRVERAPWTYGGVQAEIFFMDFFALMQSLGES